MRLPNDVSRCAGGTINRPCPDRNQCERFKQRKTVGTWGSMTDFYEPRSLYGCFYKIEPSESEVVAKYRAKYADALRRLRQLRGLSRSQEEALGLMEGGQL